MTGPEFETAGVALGAPAVRVRVLLSDDGTIEGVALPYKVSAATSAAPEPRGTHAARARGAGAEGRS